MLTCLELNYFTIPLNIVHEGFVHFSLCHPLAFLFRNLSILPIYIYIWRSTLMFSLSNCFPITMALLFAFAGSHERSTDSSRWFHIWRRGNTRMVQEWTQYLANDKSWAWKLQSGPQLCASLCNSTVATTVVRFCVLILLLVWFFQSSLCSCIS